MSCKFGSLKKNLNLFFLKPKMVLDIYLRMTMNLESIALHSGYTSESTTKAATTPIYQTTSFTFDNTQHGADLFDLKLKVIFIQEL